MNFLKNLIIIAVLAAVGYGVYVSLSHNSESAQATSSAPGWPALNVEMPSVSSAIASLKGVTNSTSPTLPPSVTPGSPSTVAPPFMNPASPAAQANAVGAMASAWASNAVSIVGRAVDQHSAHGHVSRFRLPRSRLPACWLVPASPWRLAAHRRRVPSRVQRRPAIWCANLAPPPEVAAASAAAAPCVDEVFLSKFKAFMWEVQKRLDERKFAEALLALSSLYNDPNLPPLPAEQKKQLDDLLGKLAGTVIYSRQHFLEKPYVVQPGDTLDKIAQQCRIPWQLLGRINGLLSPNGDVNDNESKDRPLPVGSEMKVLHGPFEAVVNLSRHELTLMLDGRYAGRFPIGVGRDQANLEGVYTVRDKTPNPTYRGADVQYGAGDPRNPLGSALDRPVRPHRHPRIEQSTRHRPRRQSRLDLRAQPRDSRPLRNSLRGVAGDDRALEARRRSLLHCAAGRTSGQSQSCASSPF